MNKILFTTILFSFASLPAIADVCGHVNKGSKNAQLIPIQGKIKTQLVKDDILSCGSMLITHEDSVWIELSDLTQFKVAPNTFIEFSKKENLRHQLFRGEVMVVAPPSIREFELTTPNSVTLFHGGVMLVRYAPKNKETILASFNRKVTFKNKFHLDAEQVVDAGEMSRLWIGESRIVPSQPELMNPRSVKMAFQPFGLEKDEITELTAVIQRAEVSRSKSLVADLESWEDIEKDNGGSISRSLASVSIEPKEADIGLALLKKHLYGDETDRKMFNDPGSSEDLRNPASIRPSEKFNDTQYQRKKAKESSQMKKVLENIRNFDPEND